MRQQPEEGSRGEFKLFGTVSILFAVDLVACY